MKTISKIVFTMVFTILITAHAFAQVNNFLYEDEACGLNYVAATANLHQRGGPSPAPQVQPVTLNTTCNGSTIRRAFIFFTCVGSPAPANIPITINGNVVNATQDAIHGQATCWEPDYATTSTYIADVTALAVSGNNIVDNIPVSGNGGLDANGVCLLVVCNTPCPAAGNINRGHIRIQTGLRMHTVSGASVDNLNFGNMPSGNTTGFMIIGDAESPNNDEHLINNNLAQFNGDMYNFVQLNNPFGALLTVPFESDKFGTDCTNLSVIGGYYSIPNACSALNLAVASTPSECGRCNGTATVTVMGGAAPYTYSWNSVPVQTTATATNLCPGSYTVTVTDANGCTSTATVDVDQSTDILVSVSTTAASCAGVCNGTATATVTSGGTSPYSYLWSNGATTASVNNLCAGPFSVTVTDATGCTATFNGVIGMGQGTQATVATTKESCNGTCDGTATITVTFGNGPFTFNWSTGATTQAVTGLCPNNYSVSITDGNGCKITLPVIIQPGADCKKCEKVPNNAPQTNPIPDQDCWWSTGGNSVASVSDLNQLGTTNSNHLRIVTTNTERIRVDRNGYVGVNTINFNNYLLTRPIFKSLGTSLFTLNDNHYINPYNSTPYTLLVDCSDRDGHASNGIGIISPETNVRNDRLSIYANDLGQVNFVSLGNTSVFRDKIFSQELWGTVPSKGCVAMVPDFTAQMANSANFHARLWAESNDQNAHGTGTMPAIVALNRQGGHLNVSEKVAISARSIGDPRTVGHVPCTNIAGRFIAENSSESNHGIQARSTSAANNPVTNIGGVFDACGATNNYALLARIPYGCQGAVNLAAYFVGNVAVNGSGTYVGTWTQGSDRKLKSEITPLKSVADILEKINVYSFKYNQGEYKSLNLPDGKHYGVVAQELQAVLPELVTKNRFGPEYDSDTQEKTSDGVDFLSVNYIELIPLLIQGAKDQEEKIQTQEKSIDDLQNRIHSMENALAECCTSFENQNAKAAGEDKAILDQNIPNPFDQKTVIGFYIPSTLMNSSIHIYTVDGHEVSKFENLQTGKGSVTISSGVLAPGAYLYNLIADGKQIDSKWMVVTK